MTYQALKKYIDEVIVSKENHKNLLLQKYSSDEYDRFKEFTSSLRIGGKKAGSFRMSGASLGCITPKSVKNTDLKIQYLMTIEKSIFGPFFTVYMNCAVSFCDGLDPVSFPRTIITSPGDRYKEYFNEVWSEVKIFFPNAIYISKRDLRKKEIVKGFDEEQTIYDLFFGGIPKFLELPQIGYPYYKPE